MFSGYKKGQLAIALIMLIIIVTILIVGAIFAPMGVQFATITYGVGEQILNNTQDDLDNIQDSNIRNSINTTITQSKNNTDESITIYGALYRYAPIIAVIIVILIAFLLARRSVETGQIL